MITRLFLLKSSYNKDYSNFNFRRYEITLSKTATLFEFKDNTYRVKGHTYLDYKEVPDMGPGETFYGIIPNNFAAKLGLILGKYQNVTWGTGTHTSSPVGLFSYGQKPWIENYRGAMHSTEVGLENLSSLGLSEEKTMIRHTQESH